MTRLQLTLALAIAAAAAMAAVPRQFSGVSEPEQVFRLEIPELSVMVPGDGDGTIERSDVRRFQIVMAKPASQMDYGSIKAKINTESANIVMNYKSVGDTIVCDFDLLQRAGFQFHPGKNSVEIVAQDSRHHYKFYSSFVLAAPLQPARRGVAPSREAPAVLRGVQKFAVIIGVSRFQDKSIPSLDYPDRDAEAMRDFLLSAQGGSFPPANITYLVNENATLTKVRTALFSFLTKPQENDIVVIYFAGHGLPDPLDRQNLYLATYDSVARNLGGTALPMWDFQEVFSRIVKSRRIVTYADACHSRGIGGGIGPGIAGESPEKGHNLVNQYVFRYAGEGQHAVITASDIGESSVESSKWGGGHGVFTYYLLEGLRGKADANKDGTVTAEEAFNYVKEQVQKATDGQTPQALPGLSGNLPLAGVALRADIVPQLRLRSLPSDAMNLFSTSHR